jgi:arylsulfatase A-like enzyme
MTSSLRKRAKMKTATSVWYRSNILLTSVFFVAAWLLAMPSIPVLAGSASDGSNPLSSRDAVGRWEPEPSAPEGAPNVLVILLDDTGFADFGAFGSEIETPNIDRLAAGGLRYNNFTTTAVCSPSRAALLTGLNHQSAGVGWLANMNSGFPGYRGEIRDDDERLVSARLQENYAAYVDNADQQIGKLIAYLEKSGELDNTIIILTSDNGASKETGTVGTTLATRYFNGLPDTTEKNLLDIDKIGGPETHPNYPHGWMQVSNTPFKFAKASTHGGGIRDPMIIHWPEGIETSGEIRPQFHHINDITPTILDVIGVDMPESFRGKKLKPMEGVSMAYTFNDGAEKSRKKKQYYELQANRAYVSTGWKIVTRVKPGQPYDSVPWELYNLNEDFSENNNLADLYPKKVKALEAKWWAAAERYNVLPVHDEPIMKRGLRSLSRLESTNYQRYEYTPGADTVHNIHAPFLFGKDFSIRAQINRENTEQQGVLAAMGGYDVGYTFFVRDNHLYYEANIGGERSTLGSSEPLPKGRLTLEAKFVLEKHDQGAGSANKSETDGNFSHQGLKSGQMTLRVNGKAIGNAHFIQPVPKSTWEGLDIGRDQRTAVSKDYRPPFAFQGDLESVIYSIDR